MDYDTLIKRIAKYKNLSIDEIDKDDLVDITKINISRKKSSKERLLDFLNEVENPYAFKFKNRIVQIGFNDESNLNAEDCLMNALKNIYK